jgi:DNA-binding transcriptional regulator YiaG
MKGKKVRELRREAGLRQTELAAELGVDNQTLCRWEVTDRELTKAQELLVLAILKDWERIEWIKENRRVKKVARRAGEGEFE